MWQCLSVIPLGRQRQEYWEFKAIIDYTVSLRLAWHTETLSQKEREEKARKEWRVGRKEGRREGERRRETERWERGNKQIWQNLHHGGYCVD